MDPFEQALSSTESEMDETLTPVDLPTGFLAMYFHIYSAFWTRSSCLETGRSAKSLLAFPTDAGPVVEFHHGPGFLFYSSHLHLLNIPVVLSAWRDLGLPRRKLYFQLSCRPASGLWGTRFIVFFLFLCILHCWSFKWCCLASVEKWVWGA